MLNFTFPILFIAVLGCIYTHLRENINRSAARLFMGKSSSFFFPCCFLIFESLTSNDFYEFIYIYSRSGGNKRSKVLKYLRRPMNIKCLGIVTGIELAFFGMFIVLCSWYFSAYMHFGMEKITITAMTRGDKV